MTVQPLEKRRSGAPPATRARVRRSSRVGALIATLVIGTAVGRALSATPSRLPAHTTAAQRAEIRQGFARLEPQWRDAARVAFPGDLWSQDDDFQRRELEHARDLARKLGVSLADVFDAIDEGLHAEAWPGEVRRATVHACKPRPFYE